MEIGMLPGFPDKEESHGVYKKNQTKISVAETAFLINPLVFAERLGGKRDPASGRPQAGGGRKIPNCKTINTAKKQKNKEKRSPRVCAACSVTKSCGSYIFQKEFGAGTLGASSAAPVCKGRTRRSEPSPTRTVSSKN